MKQNKRPHTVNNKFSLRPFFRYLARHYFKVVPLTFAGLYVIFALWVLGTKFFYEHPRLTPEIHLGGKVDDWQYTPARSYVSSSTYAGGLTDSRTVAQHYQDYLKAGFWLAAFFTVYLLITLTLIRSIYRGVIIYHYAAGDKDQRRLGLAKIAVVLPVLAVIVWSTLIFISEEIFYSSDFLELLAAIITLAMPFVILADLTYLFVSGLMNYGSERPEVKKVGANKIAWSLVYGLIIAVAWAIFNLFTTISFSNDITIPSFVDSGSSPMTSNALSPTNMGMAVNTDTAVKSGLSVSRLLPSSGSGANMAAIDSFVADETIGLAVGGANDVNNFRENIKNGYLPEPTDITYEGLFYDYYFDTGITKPCEKLFCPSYTASKSADPYTGEEQYFLSVGLNSGIKESDFARKPLNLMVVMDISGSMGSTFQGYYYDGDRGSDDTRSKMEIANETLVNLMEHLEDEDRLSVVLFDDQAYLAKPFRKVKDTDMNAIAKHVLEIKPRGGTNMSVGIQEAVKQFETIDLKDTKCDNRVIFLTDAMPNQGETSEKGLFGQLRELSLDRVYTTFIGVGVDLNSELIDALTKMRGANYYAVHSALEFKARLADEFEYMVTPLVFDLTLSVDAPGYEIMHVYGSPEADQATGKIMAVNTLYPSASRDGENKGGLVLLQLKKRAGATNDQIRVRTTYQDRDGIRDGSEEIVNFADTPINSGTTGIAKDIVLARYASVIKDWLLSSRYNDMLTYNQDKVKISNMSTIGAQHYLTEGIRPVRWSLSDGRWERGSRPLTVSSDYATIFQTLRDYMSREISAISDDSLRQETDILDLLIAMGEVNDTASIEEVTDEQLQINSGIVQANDSQTKLVYQQITGEQQGQMQNWNGCSEIATPRPGLVSDTVMLTDARDGKQYPVRKFADGRCWMVDNLAYGENCNKDNFCAYGYKDDGKTCIVEKEQAKSIIDKVGPGLYGDCRSSKDYPGFLYTWQAATQRADGYYGGSAITDRSDVIIGLCPAGWHVPSAVEYDKLRAEYSDKNFFHFDGGWHSTYAGYANDVGIISAQDYGGFYWTSWSFDPANADFKILGEFSGGFGLLKHMGVGLRCINDLS